MRRTQTRVSVSCRARLGLPQLPVLQVAITCRNATIAPLAERVRAGQLAARLPALRTVDAEGLELAVRLMHCVPDLALPPSTRSAPSRRGGHGIVCLSCQLRMSAQHSLTLSTPAEPCQCRVGPVKNDAAATPIAYGMPELACND